MRMQRTYISLKSAAVDNLVVNSELAALVVDDKHSDASSSVVEGLGEAVEKVTLVEDW